MEENFVKIPEVIETVDPKTSIDDGVYGFIKDETVVMGNNEQRIAMYTDWSKYFAEVTNPDNTTMNTFFRAKYAPLNEVLNTIRPIMGKYGLSIIQVPMVYENKPGVQTIVTHKDGASISFPVVTGKITKDDIQGFGATISYLRRFAVNAIAGVMGEVDDDGNATAKKQPEIDEVVVELRKETIAMIKNLGGSKNKELIEVIKKHIKSANPNNIESKGELEALKKDLEKFILEHGETKINSSDKDNE